MFVELEKSACVHIMNLFNEHFSEESSHISINYLYYIYNIYINVNICCFTTPTRMRSSIHFVFSAHKLLLWPKGASENNICFLLSLKDLVCLEKNTYFLDIFLCNLENSWKRWERSMAKAGKLWLRNVELLKSYKELNEILFLLKNRT